MRTAVLGGTFDPVHIGHLLMADEVLSRCNYERILFVPNRIPPHKDRIPDATPAQRLAMLELAIRDREEFAVDTYEIERGKVSYTVDTLEHLYASGTVTGRLGLIIGEDLVDGFDRWRDVDRVTEMADLILVRRPGNGSVRFRRVHTLIDSLSVDVSSTEIRDRISSGWPFRYLVHHRVYDYIEKQGLYR